MQQATAAPVSALLRGAGLAETTIDAWLEAEPKAIGELAEDRRRYAAFWHCSERLIGDLPKKTARRPLEAQAADAICEKSRAARERFLRTHVEAIYASITQGFSRFIRVEELVFAAAEAFPGLAPTREQIATE